MTRLARIVLVTSILALPLGACASIGDALDPTDWFSGDLFGSKKKLPGERKPVFPEGVPGVAQGIPQDLVKGHQPENGFAAEEPQSVASTQRQAAATTQPTEEFQPAPREKAKPKPKPKPKTAARQPERAPTSVTVRRPPKTQQQEEQPQQQQANGGGQWPEPQQQPPQQQRSSGQSGGVQWPDPPAAQRGGTQSGGVQWPDPPPLR